MSEWLLDEEGWHEKHGSVSVGLSHSWHMDVANFTKNVASTNNHLQNNDWK